MGILKSPNCLSVVGIAFLLPLVSLAGTSSCSGLAPTYPANYSQQASGLLEGIRDDARRAATRIAQLKPFASSSNTSWDFQTEELIGIQSQVNDMESKVCRLKTIGPVLPRAQQGTIRGVVSEVRSLTARTRAALRHARARTGQLWSPSYKMETQNAYREATMIASTIEHRELLGRRHANAMTLEETPGVTGK
jgi:hypothetical protein